eukprot:TRINITY_DN78403_c0_g1_i1.p1 TRINITY_DN78403_c0_g1~~TRINITY_DN78403_c0_g1_i1.p1  ORF type:complete len:292 (-),score=72.19 TRINITY_DN78403_c0_g1_i1:190-1065(-)
MTEGGTEHAMNESVLLIDSPKRPAGERSQESACKNIRLAGLLLVGFILLVLLAPASHAPKPSGDVEALQVLSAETSSILPHVEVVPYGVLGVQLTAHGIFAKKGSSPSAGTAVVDPAGLRFIQSLGPAGACCASAAVYDWVGIRNDAAFPESVRESVQDETDAAFHKYGDRDVIHVVGPDFFASDANSKGKELAVEDLTKAYGNVLSEFVASGAARLRLLPISGGTFAGPFKKDLPEMTFTALENSFISLSQHSQEALLEALGDGKIEMCIFEEKELASFQSACDACSAKP